MISNEFETVPPKSIETNVFFVINGSSSFGITLYPIVKVTEANELTLIMYSGFV